MENLYTWEFSSDKGRGKMWYIIALSVIIGLVIWGFLTRQYVMGFLVILVSGISFFIENNSEEKVVVSINNLGIRVNSNFYEFSKIYSFSIVYDSGNATFMRLFLKKKGLKSIDLNIDNNIAYDLKQILPNFVKEDEDGEVGTVDRIIKILKL